MGIDAYDGMRNKAGCNTYVSAHKCGEDMKLFLFFAAVSGTLLSVLLSLRVYDWIADRVQWHCLAAMQPADPPRFDPGMIDGLPESARRYFTFAIAPGTPLWTVAAIEMQGMFSLGNKETPGYRPMKARQLLAAPHGFIWQMHLMGGVPVSGSDAGSTTRSWTRFRIFGLIPVARAGNNEDHRRSAYGRYIAEALFWSPAALLPGPGVTWQAVDDDTARVTVSSGGMTQSAEIGVNAEGKPIRISFIRWSNANPKKVYRLQPFGGTLSDFREVQGFRLPFHVEGGNMFGTDDYFPFYRADVTDIRFPRPDN